MTEIQRPFVTDDDPERHVRCQDAIYPAFKDLVDRAEAAGWHRRELLAALTELVDNEMLGIAANDDRAELLQILKRLYRNR